MATRLFTRCRVTNGIHLLVGAIRYVLHKGEESDRGHDLNCAQTAARGT
jgi:hypothetical protein